MRDRTRRFLRDASFLLPHIEGHSIYMKYLSDNVDTQGKRGRKGNSDLSDEVELDRDIVTQLAQNEFPDKCFKCQNELNIRTVRVRIKPKAKTSATVLRLAKQRDRKKRSTNKFMTHVLDNYFNRTNSLNVTCIRCGFSTKKHGLKRSDSSFVEKHSKRSKLKRVKLKEKRKQEISVESVDKKLSRSSSDLDVSSSGLGSSLSMLCSSSPRPSDSRSMSVSSTSSFKTPKRVATSSPMASLPSSAQKSISKKPSVTPRVDATDSKVILKKFQQQQLGQLFKAKTKDKNKNQSALQSFLSSI